MAFKRLNDLKLERVEQKLQQVKEIAEDLVTATPEYHSCYYKDECGPKCTPKKRGEIDYCCYEKVDEILKIIRK